MDSVEVTVKCGDVILKFERGIVTSLDVIRKRLVETAVRMRHDSEGIESVDVSAAELRFYGIQFLTCF